MLVVFDLDGTVIDSRRDLTDSANEMLAEYRAPPLGEEEIGPSLTSEPRRMPVSGYVWPATDSGFSTCRRLS